MISLAVAGTVIESARGRSGGFANCFTGAAFSSYKEVPIWRCWVHSNVKSSCRMLVHLHSLLQGVGDNQGVVGQECQRGGGGGRLMSDIG